jgi:hypothetical protein
MHWEFGSNLFEAWVAEARGRWAELRRQLRPDEKPSVTVAIGPGQPPAVVAPSATTVCGPRDKAIEKTGRLIVTPALPLTVTPPSRDAWDEHGWRAIRRGADAVYEGEYRARRWSGRPVTFPGRIVRQGGVISAYVADPPTQIRRHPKGPCFQLTNPPWFRVHWHRPPTSVDDALLYVERILNEVLN